MGLLFAAFLLAMLASIGFGSVFAISLIFVPARRAFLFALAAVPGGGAGALLGCVLATVILTGAGMVRSETDVLILLGVIAAGGVLGMAAAIWLAARYRTDAANP